MKKMNVIISGLAFAGMLTFAGTQAQASSYHNGIPTAIRGSWRTKTDHGNQYVFKFGKKTISNYIRVKSGLKWHTLQQSINPINTFNYSARYRKISTHSYYLLPKKGSSTRTGANGVKIVKKSNKRIAVKYHYSRNSWMPDIKTGWGPYQTLYKK